MARLSTRRASDTVLAPPLPIKNQLFLNNRIVLRRGQFTLLAAAPSVGKSLVARNLVSHTPCPTVYCSADSDEYTVKVSVSAHLSGQPMEKVEETIFDEGWADYYGKLLSQLDHVDWCYNTALDTEFLAQRLNAYAEIQGDFPHLVVIDNVGDMVEDENDEYGQLREICRELRRMARATNSHVLGLHHAKGAWEDGTKPITLGALLGNLGKTPENVLGLHWDTPDQTRVVLTVPKMRGAKRGLTIPLPTDYPTGTIGGFGI